MEDDLQILDDLVIPGSEIAFSASRSGGPGGQNVNKVATRVTIRWSPGTSRALDGSRRALVLENLRARLTGSGEIVIHSDVHRSQARNREEARLRLRGIVRRALVRRRPRRPTRPTRASVEKRLERKRRRASVKRGRRKPGPDE